MRQWSGFRYDRPSSHMSDRSSRTQAIALATSDLWLLQGSTRTGAVKGPFRTGFVSGSGTSFSSVEDKGEAVPTFSPRLAIAGSCANASPVGQLVMPRSDRSHQMPGDVLAYARHLACGRRQLKSGG